MGFDLTKAYSDGFDPILLARWQTLTQWDICACASDSLGQAT